DLLVQVEELRGRDDAGVERAQPVLNSDVVEYAQRRARRRIHAVHVARFVERRRPCALRVLRRIVAEFYRPPAVPAGGPIARDVLAVGNRIDAPGLIGGVFKRLDALVAADRDLLRVRQTGWIRHVEVVREQMAVLARHRNRERVWKRGTDLDAVEEAR